MELRIVVYDLRGRPRLVKRHRVGGLEAVLRVLRRYRRRGFRRVEAWLIAPGTCVMVDRWGV